MGYINVGTVITKCLLLNVPVKGKTLVSGTLS